MKKFLLAPALHPHLAVFQTSYSPLRKAKMEITMLKPILLCIPLFLSPIAHAQEAAERYVTVSASGEAERVPDTAILSFAVVTEGETAGAAFQANNEQASRLVEGLKALGVSAKDITTRNISIQPRYDYSGNDRGQPPRITGYTAENEVQVTFNTLDGLGEKLDQAVELGANRVSGPQFIVSDPVEAEAEARKKAFAAAYAKAQTYAEAGGFKLGNILMVEESQGYQALPRPMKMRAEMVEKASAPVEAGTASLSVNVTVRIAIE